MKNKALGVESGAVFGLLIIFAFGMVRPLGAGARAGVQLKVATKDGAIVQGELLAVKGRSLLVDGRNYDSSSAIELDDIRDLTIFGKSKASLGLGIGLLGGAAAGAIIGATIPVQETGYFAMPFLDRWRNTAYGAGVGAAVGAIVGALVGSDVHQEERLIVASVYQLEPGELLKKLRAAAKDPEYR
jgi:hypothetical protein